MLELYFVAVRRRRWMLSRTGAGAPASSTIWREQAAAAAVSAVLLVVAAVHVGVFPVVKSHARISGAAVAARHRLADGAVTSSHARSSAPAPVWATHLPDGGQTILPRLRVVAYYGGPDGPALGVLGAGAPTHAAAAVTARAKAYAGYGRPVQPAMELLATVAQGSPGRNGTYSRGVRTSQIASYLAAAHAHRLLLILDIQPGAGEFLPQVKALEPFLLDPAVSVALDPEWKVPPGQRPGHGRIGSSSAASVNAVGAYLSQLIAVHSLPDKLLIIHQFRTSMLPDRGRIKRFAGVEEVLHADGEGSPKLKRAVFGQLAFPVPRFGVGFKLFFTQDTRLMSPAEVMALEPRPDIVTYQ